MQGDDAAPGEASREALDELRREVDLGHENERLPAARQDGLCRAQVDLGFAASRDAVQQDRLGRNRRECDVDPRRPPGRNAVAHGRIVVLGLKIAVVAMGILIVAGVAVLGLTLVNRMSSAGTPIATILLDEPAQTRIAGTALAPDRLSLQLQGGGPDRVVVIDLKAGRILGRVALGH